MKKLKTLVLSAIMGLSVSCTPLMAAPYFDTIDIARFYTFCDRIDMHNLDMVEDLLPEECAMLITYMLESIRYNHINGRPIVNYAFNINRNGLHTFSREWLKQADQEEINQQMIYLLNDIDNFDIKYFGVNFRGTPGLYERVRTWLGIILESLQRRGLFE